MVNNLVVVAAAAAAATGEEEEEVWGTRGGRDRNGKKVD